MFTKDNLTQLFESFNKLRILVVGDIMLDAYVWGKVDRISPEAPVPIVSIQKRTNRLGGAANVALNIKSMGAEPIICSVIGKDQKGEELINVFKEESLTTDGIIQSEDRITTTKFRIFGNNAQMLRIDEEVTRDLNKTEEERLMEKVRELFASDKIDAVVFQDYNKGNLTLTTITEIIKLANHYQVPTSVDPKSKNFFEFKKVSLFKPNLKELQEGLNTYLEKVTKEKLVELTNKLNEILGAGMLMTTLSEHGVFINQFVDDKIPGASMIPAHKRSISDVSGAGDTVISVATLCLAFKLSPTQIAALSNLAGGIVCEEVGVVPIAKDRLLKEAMNLLTS